MIANFLRAIRSYGRAFRLIVKLRLWGYFLIPALISMLFGTGIYYGAIGIADRFDEFLVSWYPWEWGRSALESVSYWITLIGVWGIALLIYRHIVVVLSSPFMSPLAERVEQHLTGRKSTAKFNLSHTISDLIRGLRVAIRNIIREVFFTLLLMLAGLIMPVIAPITTVLAFLVQAYYAGFGNMDYTLERHANVRQSARFVRQNRGLAMGNGSVFLFFIFTIVGVIIAPPLATVAAAIDTVPRLGIESNEVEDYLV